MYIIIILKGLYIISFEKNSFIIFFNVFQEDTFSQ